MFDLTELIGGNPVDGHALVLTCMYSRDNEQPIIDINLISAHTEI